MEVWGIIHSMHVHCAVIMLLSLQNILVLQIRQGISVSNYTAGGQWQRLHRYSKKLRKRKSVAVTVNANNNDISNGMFTSCEDRRSLWINFPQCDLSVDMEWFCLTLLLILWLHPCSLFTLSVAGWISTAVLSASSTPVDISTAHYDVCCFQCHFLHVAVNVVHTAVL